MKTLKSIILTGVLTINIVFATNTIAADYMVDAEKYFEEGNYKAAIIQLKNHLKEHTNDTEARFLLGKSYLKTGNIKQAEKEFSRSYQMNSTHEEIALTYSKVLLLQKKYKKINEILNSKFQDKNNENQRLIITAYASLGQNQLSDAKKTFSDLSTQFENAQVYNGLAKIAILEKKLDLANQWVKKALKIEPEDTVALQTKAEIEIGKKNYVEALNIYDNLIQKQENNLLFYLKRSAIKIQLGDNQGAETDIQKVLGKVKNQPQANYMLAQIRLQERKFEESKVAAQNVLNIMPRDYSSMLILGTSHFGLGNYNQAEKYLTQYLSGYPDNIFAQNVLANVYLAQNKGEQALLILEGIDEEKRNNNAMLLMTLGSVYLLTGEHSKGVEFLEMAKKLEPENESVQKKLISGYYISGDFENLIDILEKKLKKDKLDKGTIFLLVHLYIQKNELQKAEGKLKELSQISGKNPDIYNLIAIVEKLKGNNQKVKDAYNEALRLDNSYIPAYVGLAELSNEEKNWKLAHEYYSKVVQLNPKYVKAYIFLAAIAENQNQEQEVEKILKIGIENSKGDLESQIYVANILSLWYLKQNTPEKILPIAKGFIRMYPNDNHALAFLSDAQIANQNLDTAIKTLKTIINNDSLNVKHRLILVDLMVKTNGNENDILELLDSVIKIVPDNPEPVMIKASYLLKNKKYEQVLETANYAEKQFPNLILGYLLKADVYRIQNKPDKALINYHQAYKLQPNYKVLFSLCDLLLSQGKESEALKLLKGELEKNDKNLAVHFKMAEIYQAQKMPDLAAQHYLTMLTIKDDNLLALNNLAWLYLQEKNNEAINLAKKAYSLSPNSSSVLDTYGYILIKQGDITEGVKLLEQAGKMAPGNFNIRYHLAEAYHLNGENKKGRVLLNSILNGKTEFSEKENAKALYKKLQ